MSDSVRPYGQQTTRLCPRDSLAGILEWFAISFSNRIHKHKLSRPLITSHLINKECRQCDGVSGPRPCQCHHRDRQQLDSTGRLPKLGEELLLAIRGQGDICAQSLGWPWNVTFRVNLKITSCSHFCHGFYSKDHDIIFQSLKVTQVRQVAQSET